jgi:membrane protease YdiL (CAAX protease family)
LILALYLWFYLFAIQISRLRPINSQIAWSLANYLIVVFAEEIYFRGVLFAIIQRYFSPKAALLISSLVFGLIHIPQGFLSFLDKLIAGWLWGTVRYSTGMIFLLIIPIHFVYNTIWLLFEGNWGNPPPWAYFFPLVEILFGVGIMIISSRTSKLSTMEI